MANIFSDFWTRLKIDYIEWRNEMVTNWNTRRETRQIQSAIKRAKERNSMDHKTYFIIKDRRGAYNALTGREIDRFSGPRGYFPKMNYYQKISNSVYLVTSRQRDTV